MIRKSFYCWLTTLLLGPACALALEVGEIQVNSALNQLFDARIPLPTLTPEELGKITAKLAGAADVQGIWPGADSSLGESGVCR
jgi:Tfp pilus assembly protein FimV